MRASRAAAVLIVMAAFLAVQFPASAEGELTLYGGVYGSDGDPVLDRSECQSDDCTRVTFFVRVYYNESGEPALYQDFPVEQIEAGSVWRVTIGSGGWAPGLPFQVWIDGKMWDDKEYWASDVDFEKVQWFFFPDSPPYGSMRVDVAAPSKIPLAPPVPGNIKPLLAMVFALVIIILGVLFVLLLPRQKVRVEFTGKARILETDAKGVQRAFYKYHCSYVGLTGPLPVGEIPRTEEDIELYQTREVGVLRIVKNPDGTFAWHAPKAIPLKDKAKQLRQMDPRGPPVVYNLDGKPLLTMDGLRMEAVWRAGGKITLHTGQEPKKAISQKTFSQFLFYVLPWALVEFFIGLASGATGILAVDPANPIGLGFVVNLLILILALALALTVFTLVTRPKMPEEEQRPPQPQAPPGPQPSPFDMAPVYGEPAPEAPADIPPPDEGYPPPGPGPQGPPPDQYPPPQ